MKAYRIESTCNSATDLAASIDFLLATVSVENVVIPIGHYAYLLLEYGVNPDLLKLCTWEDNEVISEYDVNNYHSAMDIARDVMHLYNRVTPLPCMWDC